MPSNSITIILILFGCTIGIGRAQISPNMLQELSGKNSLLDTDPFAVVSQLVEFFQKLSVEVHTLTPTVLLLRWYKF